MIRLDFETYSEAGFVWDTDAQKWKPPKGAMKKGLPVVGAAAYVRHPTFEVLTMSYDLGYGVQRWKPGEVAPVSLLHAVASGRLVSGWNSGGFEFKVWNSHLAPRLGWPMLHLEQLRDTMACSRAHALPGSLDKAGEVLQVANLKDKDGKRLLDKFSIPRNPTKADPRLRIAPQDDPADAENLYEYCDQDVRAEADIAARIPELSELELAVWRTDRRINDRGVQIDLAGVDSCIALIEQAHEQYNAELRELTNGAVSKASELQKLIAWCVGFGVHTASLDEEHLDALLDGELPPVVRRALEIRQLVGSASVKKVFAMHNKVTPNERLHDLFLYHAARTGRVTGSGPQPTNLPNSAGVHVLQCEACDKHYGLHRKNCPHCGTMSELACRVEWSAEAVEDALRTISTCSLGYVEHVWGDAMQAVSGCLRGLFVAAPGHDLLCSDYSAIEAVVVAELAGEEWRREVFRTHGKIYEMSAAKVVGIPLDDILAHKKSTGQHHSSRKIGKVMELACLSPDTQVLTNRGYVSIVGVSPTDKLWDGTEWVSHGGLVARGVRPVIDLDGVKMTPDHLVSTGPLWREARELASAESILCRALETGSGRLPWSVLNSEITAGCAPCGSSALAGPLRTPSSSATSSAGSPRDAAIAQKPRQQEQGWRSGTSKHSFATPRPYQTPSTGVGFSTESPLQSGVATTPKTAPITTMAGGASQSTRLGGRIGLSSFGTSLLLKVGTTRCLKWIARTIAEGMSRGTSGLPQRNGTTGTKERCANFKQELNTLSPVYDIANAGSRNRFTIKTDSGHLIVHNCGYQGWIGSMLAFGADEFMTEAEMKDAILAWRAASPAIVELWGGQERNWQPELYGIEGAFVYACLNPGVEAWVRGMRLQRRESATGDAVYIRLLSGRELTYHRPVLSPSSRRPGTYSISYEGWNSNPNNGPTGWIRMETWGGRLVENIVQATARDIQWHGIMALEAAGYPIVLHVYDEDVAEVPEDFGSIEEFERIMSTMPTWAAGWPIKANGGWRGKRYRKG